MELHLLTSYCPGSRDGTRSFEDELAVRAFAQRFLALRQRGLESQQKKREQLYRLRVSDDDSETRSVWTASEAGDDKPKPETCPSESGSRASTIVEEDTELEKKDAKSETKVR